MLVGNCFSVSIMDFVVLESVTREFDVCNCSPGCVCFCSVFAEFESFSDFAGILLENIAPIVGSKEC